MLAFIQPTTVDNEPVYLQTRCFFLFIFVFFKLLSCLKYDKIILDLGVVQC